MLRSLKEIEGYDVAATDGDVGRVTDFLLEDNRWTVRFVVVDANDRGAGWRRVLLSPIAFRGADAATRRLAVELTQAKVEGSPNVDTERPVSRQHEQDNLAYYGYPFYWGYPSLWGLGEVPSYLALSDAKAHDARAASGHPDDVHLRSAKEVRGYHVEGSDGSIGHIHDFIVDEESWELRYLVVDTSNWWMGKKVLIAPRWATEVSWADRKVTVNMTRDEIRHSPLWDPSEPVNSAYETQLYDYYGRPSGPPMLSRAQYGKIAPSAR